MALIDKTATIANAQTTSDTIDTGLLTTYPQTAFIAITFPASMTGTTMTFQRASTSNGTFTALREVGGANAYSITVTSSATVPLDPRVFLNAAFVKCVSGSSETGAKSLTLHFHEVV